MAGGQAIGPLLRPLFQPPRHRSGTASVDLTPLVGWFRVSHTAGSGELVVDEEGLLGLARAIQSHFGVPPEQQASWLREDI